MKGWTNFYATWWQGPPRRGLPLLVWQRPSGNWYWGDDQVAAEGPFSSLESAVKAAEAAGIQPPRAA